MRLWFQRWFTTWKIQSIELFAAISLNNPMSFSPLRLIWGVFPIHSFQRVQ